MNKYTMSKTPQVKVIACASLLALLLLVSIGCGKGTDAKQDGAGTAEIAVPVKVVVAGQGQSGGQMLATGTLEPVNQTPIGCKVGGIVAAVHVEVGDRVKKGQPLVTLQLTDYQLGVQQATAAYQSAQVNFETAEKNYQRVTNLKNDGSISAADFDQATLGYKAAKYGLEQAEAAWKLAKNALGDAVIRAPYDGQVTMRMVNLGGYVDAMTHPVLLVMVDNSRLRLTLKLSEVRAAFLSPGDEIEVYLPSNEKHLMTKIEVLTDSVDAATHTRTAIAWLDNTGPDAVPGGVFFEARIIPSALKGKILLPASSIRTETDGSWSAYIAEGNKAARTELTGKFLADHSEFVVENGVKPGDRVIAEASMVRDGQAIIVGGAKESEATPEAGKSAEETK